ncbi:MAG TPA: hypothetical protein PLI21_06880, partial [Methanomassiliicoccaceae archaeon]|nr:hypothetical protein [Methanomassiliicoccaceae archaeon]
GVKAAWSPLILAASSHGRISAQFRLRFGKASPAKCSARVAPKLYAMSRTIRARMSRCCAP